MKKLICAVLAIAMCLCFSAMAERPLTDRAGNAVSLPDELNAIISLAPSITQVIVDMGLGDKLVAIDAYSAPNHPELKDLPQFDMMTPDCENMAMLEPDVIFVTGMSYVEGDNPFQPLIMLGIPVVVVPSSESIAAVKEDMLFLGECLNMPEKAREMVNGMDEILNAVAEKGAGIEDKKTVMFEIGALPYLYSFGSGTFLNEMIEMIGAVNVFGDQVSWLHLTEENAVAANPDVILTSVNYIEDSVGEILGRPGWEVVSAVANKEVYYIDNNASSLPNHHIVDALVQMAQAIYPEEYAFLTE